MQAVDEYAAVRNARVVLVDTDGVRARMTASWLAQIGMVEPFVLDHLEARKAEVADGPEPAEYLARPAAPPVIGPVELKALLEAGEAAVVDLAFSSHFRKAHIPQAWFAIRSRLSTSLPKVTQAPLLVLTSPDGVLAE